MQVRHAAPSLGPYRHQRQGATTRPVQRCSIARAVPCRRQSHQATTQPMQRGSITMTRMTARVRLSELLAALSLATDLGLGQPMEYLLRTCTLSLRLADALGLD